MLIVRYIERMLTMGDFNQQLFILRLLHNVDLDKFVMLLHGLYLEDTPAAIKHRLIDLGRSDARVISDDELLRIVAQDPDTLLISDEDNLAAALVACGERSIKQVRPFARLLLLSESVSVRVQISAAIALLCFKPSPKWQGAIDKQIYSSLALTANYRDRVDALQTLSNFFDDRKNRDNAPVNNDLMSRSGKVIGIGHENVVKQQA
eukprot:SAG11_NODE_6026_length_1407_cov_0.714067_1_plen_205_part_10